jgi:hypothetical protein
LSSYMQGYSLEAFPKSSCVNCLFLSHGAIGKWQNLEEVRPRRGKLNHWESALEGNIGTLVSLLSLLLPSHHKVSSLVLPHLYTVPLQDQATTS